MTLKRLECGFLPLVDAAPLVVARELGFAEQEGLDLVLRREQTWSALRDKLAMGRYAAAHMLTPAALAMSLGIGGISRKLDVLSLLSINGDVIGAARGLADRIRDGGPPLDVNDAKTVGARLLETAPQPLRVGVPFPFSTHLELVDYWLDRAGIPSDRWTALTVPPPQMADAAASGDIDMFCVGEPWGGQAVETGAAEIILAGSAIWRFAPEKSLAVMSEWAEAEPSVVARLMRAIWRAGAWLSDPANRTTATEFLAWPRYVGAPADMIDRSLSGRLVVAPEGYEARAEGFIEFFESAATFPWRSQALWFASRLALRHQIDKATTNAVARATFRPDLYRANLGPIGADLPGASEKIEGALAERTPVASSRGSTYLGPDQFFDGAVFDFST